MPTKKDTKEKDTTKKDAGEKAAKEKAAKEKKIGKVVHYYTKLGVAAIELTDSLKAGDTIHIKGHTSDFNQKVDSIQIEHKTVQEAKKGDAIGLKISEHARENDQVLKVG